MGVEIAGIEKIVPYWLAFRINLREIFFEIRIDGFMSGGDFGGRKMKMFDNILTPKITGDDNSIGFDGDVSNQNVKKLFWPIKKGIFGSIGFASEKMFNEVVNGDNRSAKIKQRFVEMGKVD